MFCLQILTKTGELSRQPTTHPEETEEELTEQQEALLGEGALTMPREGSTESESTQEDLEEEEEEEVEEEEDCIQVKDEEGESGPEEGPDLEESSTGYKKVHPPLCPWSQFLAPTLLVFPISFAPLPVPLPSRPVASFLKSRRGGGMPAGSRRENCCVGT
jgi:histone deacetylase 4/5